MDNSLRPFSGSGMGDGPAISVEPMNLHFEALGPDSEQVQTFTSIGGGALVVEDLEITGQSSGSFTLLDSPSDLTLEVGESVDIDVAFSAMGNGEQSATATVRSTDAFAPLVPVSLLGEGVVSELQLAPDPLAFGNIGVGCDRDNAVVMTNIGSESLEVLTIEGPSGSFSLRDVPALPLLLAPGEQASVGIGFVPEIEGDFTGSLTVTSTEPQGTRVATQTGTGLVEDWQEDHWEHSIDPPTDILFSVDQSCSMDDDIERLGSNFSSFIGQLSDYSEDWQVMVVNDDDGCSNSGILTPTAPGYATTFSQAVSEFDQECLVWGWLGTGIPCYTEALLTTTNAVAFDTDAPEGGDSVTIGYGPVGDCD